MNLFSPEVLKKMKGDQFYLTSGHKNEELQSDNESFTRDKNDPINNFSEGRTF